MFAFCGFYMMLIAGNSVILSMGICSRPLRALSLCLAGLLSCINIAGIILTAVFRFNTWGKLAALSTMVDNYSYKCVVENEKYCQTYEFTGNRIVAIWIT